jgi:hypothetical protein
MALAVARESDGDWSPEAVLWLYALADCDEDLIRRRLTQFTLYAAARAAIRVRPEPLAAAVADAMAKVRTPKKRKCCPKIRERAMQFRMRAADYQAMRSAAERLLLTMIRRGIRNYLRACGYAIPRWESPAPKNPHTENQGPQTLAA